VAEARAEGKHLRRHAAENAALLGDVEVRATLFQIGAVPRLPCPHS
jgi:hypothetical protein